MSSTELLSAGLSPAESSSALALPVGFRFGAATASYQIEGAAAEGGRTPSIWDTFARIPGKVLNGDTGDVACDHYHRYAEDVALLSSLGLDSYRFSVSWSRVQPGGAGAVNPAGLDFYDRLVDELVGAGIEPALTLYHWDLPQELQDAGGWTNRATAERFAEYSAIVAAKLGDRVRLWSTLNEPWCSAFLGYAAGVHAPGHTEPAEAFAAVHHLLLGHGLATQAVRQAATDPDVGIVLNTFEVRPYLSDGTDDEVARRIDAVANRVFLEPLKNGRYPRDLLIDVADLTDFSFVKDGDLEIISTPIDFLGVNYYQPTVVSSATGEAATNAGHGSVLATPYPGSGDVLFPTLPGEHTSMGWLVDETGLTDLLVKLDELYGWPLMVTENGAAYSTGVGEDGRVRDAERTAYIEKHLAAVAAAVSRGADVRGYFAWSLLDNYEWAYGYTERFGIIHVDYDTQVRTVKDSARRYSEIVAATRAQWV
ncbi:beta-glucosidase [Nakamurella silvestris]|nr:beta-glucosidase [Nakamurella silvestris]